MGLLAALVGMVDGHLCLLRPLVACQLRQQFWVAMLLHPLMLHCSSNCRCLRLPHPLMRPVRHHRMLSARPSSDSNATVSNLESAVRQLVAEDHPKRSRCMRHHPAHL